MRILGPLVLLSRSTSRVIASLGMLPAASSGSAVVANGASVAVLPAAILLRNAHEDVFSILWALVFGFATLNILSLGARHFDANRRGLTFGECIAILVVVVSLLLLGWEMLYFFKVLPIRLPVR